MRLRVGKIKKITHAWHRYNLNLVLGAVIEAAANNQKGKVQKSKSGFQKKALQSLRTLKSNSEKSEQLRDFQPVDAEPKVQEYADEFLTVLEQKFEESPRKFSEVGRDAITNRENLITWLSKLKKKYNMVTNDVDVLESYVHQGDDLKMRWEEASKEENVLRKEVMQACAEKLLKLQKDNTLLLDLTKQLELASQEVNTLKKHKNDLEEKLKQSNQRMKLLEEQVSGQEKKLKELIQQNHNIEKQLKLKEQHNDQRLLQTQKTVDAYSNKLQNELHDMEQRANELKDAVQKKGALIEDLKQQLNIAKHQLSLRLQTDQNSDEPGKLMQAKQELDKKEEQIQNLSQDVGNLKQLLRRSEEQATSLNTQLRKLLDSAPDQQVEALKKQISSWRTWNRTPSRRCNWHIPLTELCHNISGIVL